MAAYAYGVGVFILVITEMRRPLKESGQQHAGPVAIAYTNHMPGWVHDEPPRAFVIAFWALYDFVGPVLVAFAHFVEVVWARSEVWHDPLSPQLIGVA